MQLELEGEWAQAGPEEWAESQVLVPELGTDSACSPGAPWRRPALQLAGAEHETEGCGQAAVSRRLPACGLKPGPYVCPWPLPQIPQAGVSNLRQWALAGFDLLTYPHEAVFFRRSSCL